MGQDTSPDRYDAFISYSHAADDEFAPSLQQALHRFAKPWYKLRDRHVFLDKTALPIRAACRDVAQPGSGSSRYLGVISLAQSRRPRRGARRRSPTGVSTSPTTRS